MFRIEPVAAAAMVQRETFMLLPEKGLRIAEGRTMVGLGDMTKAPHVGGLTFSEIEN
ncbi:MAG TPA: hypothetical protein VMU36_08060 [Spirochaetia bacterium]|nr:hypothetical protein [Spirochaetia bacterium]